jgi:hypothetical protein
MSMTLCPAPQLLLYVQFHVAFGLQATCQAHSVHEHRGR